MIFTKLFACIAGIRVLATMTQAVPKSDAEPDLHTLMSTLPSNDDCFHHVGVDGVIRTFHTNGTVLDYVKLKPTHIVQLLKTYHGASDLAQVLTGVNGHDVTDEKQLFYPGIALLPAEFQRQEVTVGAGVVKERRDFGEAQSEVPNYGPTTPSKICYQAKCDNASQCRAVRIDKKDHCQVCMQFGNDKQKACAPY